MKRAVNKIYDLGILKFMTKVYSKKVTKAYAPWSLCISLFIILF